MSNTKSKFSTAFTKNGTITQFTEKIPLVGHLTATVQALSGNPSQAKRALATSTNGLVVAAGAVGGYILAGPPGSMVGGALGSAVGIGVEYGIAQTIKDMDIREMVGDVSLGRFARSMAFDGFLSGLTS
ncbi:hypothetical protein HYALB_00000403 [Hymenoscyphus albidus]|uniref:Uncharacterized protein n=1 Tax=Hymenoscyphus albidus TaxID=595503 RepID=A0A9N9Q5U8_9HELO|nr:hypothetical protein HYALB_00000403 [Hymenoscyphus albidus]